MPLFWQKTLTSTAADSQNELGSLTSASASGFRKRFHLPSIAGSSEFNVYDSIPAGLAVLYNIVHVKSDAKPNEEVYVAIALRNSQNYSLLRVHRLQTSHVQAVVDAIDILSPLKIVGLASFRGAVTSYVSCAACKDGVLLAMDESGDVYCIGFVAAADLKKSTAQKNEEFGVATGHAYSQ